MRKKIKKIVMIGIIANMFMFAMGPLLTKAQSEGNVTITELRSEKSPLETMVLIMSILVWILGLIAVIFIIIGGIKWMTAKENKNKAAKAKRWIYCGVIGLIILFALVFFANFRLSKLMVW